MKKIPIFLLTLILMITLSGCSSQQVSGKYFSKENKKISMEFDKGNIVTYYNGDTSVQGAYYFEYSDDYVTVVFPEDVTWPLFGSVETSDYMTFEVVNSKNLELNFASGTALAFAKKGFLALHWKKILIIALIWEIIPSIYTKITGRELEEDIENLADKLDDAFDK